MSAIAVTKKDQIVQALLDGKRLSDIAHTLGISHQAISKQLKDDDDYIAAMDASLDVRMDQREDELESATTLLQVAVARELLSHSRFRAERLAPARWGKVESAQPVSVNLNLSSLFQTKVSDMLTSKVAIDSTSERVHTEGGTPSLLSDDAPG